MSQIYCPECRAVVHDGSAPAIGIVAHCGRQLVTPRIKAPAACRRSLTRHAIERQRKRYREILFAARQKFLTHRAAKGTWREYLASVGEDRP